jgi:hypothetical protein
VTRGWLHFADRGNPEENVSAETRSHGASQALNVIADAACGRYGVVPRLVGADLVPLSGLFPYQSGAAWFVMPPMVGA